MKLTIRFGWVMASIWMAEIMVVVVLAVHAKQASSAKEQVVKIEAKRYSYTPNEIVLKKGQPAVLEFTSLDFVHGFKVPALNIRADLPPGQVTTVRLTPQQAGTFDFLCDNFCGAGHEDMNGRIIVKD